MVLSDEPPSAQIPQGDLNGAYLLAEIFRLHREGRGGTDSALLLGHGGEDAVGVPEVLGDQELHDQLHVLLALRVGKAVLRPLQGLPQLLQL